MRLAWLRCRTSVDCSRSLTQCSFSLSQAGIYAIKLMLEMLHIWSACRVLCWSNSCSVQETVKCHLQCQCIPSSTSILEVPEYNFVPSGGNTQLT